jgi:D-glycero-beta-D-manno-heptose-7-phosphate kinase
MGVPDRRILVLGDVMLDCNVRGNVSRISPEAPVPVVEVTQMEYAPGGAANVAMNIAKLGAHAWLFGIVGDDEEGQRLHQIMEHNGIDASGVLVDAGRPTSQKMRIIAHNQQIVRVDREHRRAIERGVIDQLLEQLSGLMGKVEAVVISDYAKGVTAPELLREVIRLAQAHGIPVAVDPKGYDFAKYFGATVITPNQYEVAQFVNRDIPDEQIMHLAARRLHEELGCQAVLITRGEAGVSLFERNGRITHIPAVAREVYDVTGAGDTVVGVFMLCLATGGSFPDCAYLANCAAGIVVGKLGTATLSLQELCDAVKRTAHLAR